MFPSLSSSCSRLSTFETLQPSEMEDEQTVRARGVKKVVGRWKWKEGERKGGGKERGREGVKREGHF